MTGLTEVFCGKREAGRPDKPIDWKRVNELLEAGCPGTEVASVIGVHHDTFYTRVKKEFGIHFTEYASQFHQKGEGLLREKQYKKALKGDNSMLIWLGKNRLKQRDSYDNLNITDEDKSKLSKALDLIDYLQSKTESAKNPDCPSENNHS